MILRLTILVLAGLSFASAIEPSEASFLRAQDIAIQQVFNEVSNPISASSVAIISGRSQVALGTVVGPQLVVTKWSDLVSITAPLSIADEQGRLLAGEAIARFKEHDLVLLRVPELVAQPVDFSKATTPVVGSMIAAVTPSGLISHYGIISTPARSLREEDLPYLGIAVDPSWSKKGVLLRDVEPKSGSAKAGLESGDVILKINGHIIPNLFSLNSALKDTKPGNAVEVEFRRGQKKYQIQVRAGHRPKSVKFPEQRLEMMNSANNRMNKVREGFPIILQSDMTIEPERAGGPVIDLNGCFAGMVLSRAGRIETYILPSQTLYDLVRTHLPQQPTEVKASEIVPVVPVTPVTPNNQVSDTDEVSDFIDN